MANIYRQKLFVTLALYDAKTSDKMEMIGYMLSNAMGSKGGEEFYMEAYRNGVE